MEPGKVIIITGASSGIGYSLAVKYANNNYNVVIAARNIKKLEEISNKLGEKSSVLPVKTDVSKEEDCRNLVNKTIEEFGRIDILINNAGISMRSLFINVELNVMKRLMDVNFWGTVYCTKFALPYLIKTQGTVVGVSSVAGIHGLPARSGYSASKYAIHGFMETLRIEHRQNNLHVLVIAPGFTSSNVRKSALTADGNPQGETPRKEGRMMSPDKVADKINKAIRHRRRFIVLTFPGHFTNIVKKVWPALLDWSFFQAMKKESDSPLK